MRHGADGSDPVDVELRCPKNPSRLFARVKGLPLTVVEGNLIEVSCRDCRGRGMDRVLHRYNVLGELVETVVEPFTNNDRIMQSRTRS